MIGSSPRMWGTHRRLRAFYQAVRFIPTHVGNTRRRRSRSCPGSVHPHACGEHSHRRRKRPATSGSSPRMWGTRSYLTYEIVHHRFIPTHVGNTSDSLPESFFFSVHPHACGEHTSPYASYAPENGSSPRMWGTHCSILDTKYHSRFIPTHVGNTHRGRGEGRITSVHPHACGEHEDGLMQVLVEHGSSPRMWGTHTRKYLYFSKCRFIPTHVGNTLLLISPSRNLPS